MFTEFLGGNESVPARAQRDFRVSILGSFQAYFSLGLDFKLSCDVQASMRIFLEERDLFLRERIAGAYRTSAYFWSKSLADTPLQLLFALIFSLCGYYFVGLQPAFDRVFVYCATIVITTLAAESYVVMVSGLPIPQIV